MERQTDWRARWGSGLGKSSILECVQTAPECGAASLPVSTERSHLRCALPFRREVAQLFALDIGDGPEIHAVLRPMDDVVAVALGDFRGRHSAENGAGGPDK